MKKVYAYSKKIEYPVFHYTSVWFFNTLLKVDYIINIIYIFFLLFFLPPLFSFSLSPFQ
jgi:hypothetical protein